MDTCGPERVERFRISLNEENFASQTNTLTPSRPQRCPTVGTHGSSNDTFKPLSPHYRFVIALYSPDAIAETGLCVGRKREMSENLAAELDETLSPVRFSSKTCGIAPILSDYYSSAG